MTQSLKLRLSIFSAATILSVPGILMAIILTSEGAGGTKAYDRMFVLGVLHIIAWTMYFVMGYLWVKYGSAPITLSLIGTLIGILTFFISFLAIPASLVGYPLVISAVLMATYILLASTKTPHKFSKR